MSHLSATTCQDVLFRQGVCVYVCMRVCMCKFVRAYICSLHWHIFFFYYQLHHTPSIIRDLEGRTLTCTLTYYSVCTLTYMYMLASTHHPLKQAPSISVGGLVSEYRHCHKCILSSYIERECTYTYMHAVHLRGHIPARTHH